MNGPQNLERYVRQMRYAPLGEAGQQKIAAGRVLVCGCGALGSMLANTLVRAGVGKVRIVDRDFVETSNLQRQVLFDEQDVADNLPKAIAAANKLRRINSQVVIEPLVTDVVPDNVLELVDGIDVIVDGTDNFETRFLINDVAVQQGIPWVYGGAIGAEGQTMTILPGETACLRCLLSEPPARGATDTCDTAGILAPAVQVIASIQALEALKILSGNRQAVSRFLTVIELWDNRWRQINLAKLRDEVDCGCCRRRDFRWLAGTAGGHSEVLCGRNAVQISAAPAEAGTTRVLSLDELEKKLSAVGRVTRNRYLLRLAVDDYQLTIFPDGRAIIAGTDDLATARSLFAKYVGN